MSKLYLVAKVLEDLDLDFVEAWSYGGSCLDRTVETGAFSV